MIILIFCILVFPVAIKSSHFNGGTITWSPVDPYTNSSTVVITIIQTYAWTLSRVRCDKNVPISTGAWNNTNRNLTCVAGCSTQGNYANSPVDILTDCISSSSSLDMMKSQRAKNVTLTIGTYFSIAYKDGDWRDLGNSVSGGWSIVTLIDLRRRADGIINTPPILSITSPQYVIVNRTTRISIPVYDANEGDHIRCRWSEKNRYGFHYLIKNLSKTVKNIKSSFFTLSERTFDSCQKFTAKSVHNNSSLIRRVNEISLSEI
jgi:hypothetical protein